MQLVFRKVIRKWLLDFSVMGSPVGAFEMVGVDVWVGDD